MIALARMTAAIVAIATALLVVLVSNGLAALVEWTSQWNPRSVSDNAALGLTAFGWVAAAASAAAAYQSTMDLTAQRGEDPRSS